MDNPVPRDLGIPPMSAFCVHPLVAGSYSQKSFKLSVDVNDVVTCLSYKLYGIASPRVNLSRVRFPPPPLFSGENGGTPVFSATQLASGFVRLRIKSSYPNRFYLSIQNIK